MKNSVLFSILFVTGLVSPNVFAMDNNNDDDDEGNVFMPAQNDQQAQINGDDALAIQLQSEDKQVTATSTSSSSSSSVSSMPKKRAHPRLSQDQDNPNNDGDDNGRRKKARTISSSSSSSPSPLLTRLPSDLVGVAANFLTVGDLQEFKFVDRRCSDISRGKFGVECIKYLVLDNKHFNEGQFEAMIKSFRHNTNASFLRVSFKNCIFADGQELCDFFRNYCSGLTHLDLSGSALNDAELATILQNCSQLESLTLINSEVSGAELANALQNCFQLKHLDLSGSALNDAELAIILQSHQKLEHLHLRLCDNLTGVGLAAIVHCPQLKHLDLSVCYNCYITDTVVQALASSCQNLEQIHLIGCHITSEEIQALASRLTSLTHLSLSHCQITDTELAVILQNHPLLQSLILAACTIIGAERLSLNHCSQLKHLDLYNTRGLTDKGLAAFVCSCPLLEILNLGNCNKISDAGLSKLKVCSKLKYLFLCDEGRTNSGLWEAFQNGALLSYICNWGRITSSGLLDLVGACPDLMYLGLRSSSLVGDDFVERALKERPNLRIVRMR